MTGSPQHAVSLTIPTQALAVHGIEAVFINGTMTAEQRAQVVHDFTHDKSTARVLFFTSIGASGLNLMRADICVIYVSHTSSDDAVHSGDLPRMWFGATFKSFRSSAGFIASAKQKPFMSSS